VKVEDGQVTISGETSEKSETENGTTGMSSSFERSFPVPENVDAKKFQIEPSDRKVIVKFPKVANSGRPHPNTDAGSTDSI
jgi:HSP20 family molecular chaperone IbpA